MSALFATLNPSPANAQNPDPTFRWSGNNINITVPENTAEEYQGSGRLTINPPSGGGGVIGGVVGGESSGSGYFEGGLDAIGCRFNMSAVVNEANNRVTVTVSDSSACSNAGIRMVVRTIIPQGSTSATYEIQGTRGEGGGDGGGGGSSGRGIFNIRVRTALSFPDGPDTVTVNVRSTISSPSPNQEACDHDTCELSVDLTKAETEEGGYTIYRGSANVVGGSYTFSCEGSLPFDCGSANASVSAGGAETVYLGTPPDPTAGDEDGPICTGGAMGWILCPLSTAATGAMEVIGGIVQGLLVVQPISIAAPETEPTYIIWNTMRNIANILFIVFFLIIIGSYITSMGISNYGIKRTLPRLVIAAILVNISYFLCAIFIDIFNIIGASIEGLFQTGINAAVGGIEGYEGGGASGWQMGTYLVLLAGIVGGIVKIAGPSILLLILPPLISAVGAIITLFVILLGRQLIITILIIISPLIAVAWLLPGTEAYFKKGLNLFLSMLISYPVVMMVIQASSLLVAIIHVNGVAPSLASGEGGGAGLSLGGGPNQWLTAIAILLVQVLVAIIVFKVLQSSVRILNQLGVMGGGLVSSVRGMANDKIGAARGNSQYALNKKQKQEYRAARARGRFDRRRWQSMQRDPNGKVAQEVLDMAAWQNQSQERKRMETGSVANKLKLDKEYQKQYAGQYTDATEKEVKFDEARLGAAVAAGIKASDALGAEERANMKLLIKSDAGAISPDGLKQIASGDPRTAAMYQNSAAKLAALELAQETGNSSVLDAFMDNAHKLNEETRQEAHGIINDKHSAYRNLSSYTANGQIRQALLNGQEITPEMKTMAIQERVMAGNLSASALAGHDEGSAKQLINAANELKATAGQYETLRTKSNRSADEDRQLASLGQALAAVKAVDDNGRINVSKVDSALQQLSNSADTALRNPTTSGGLKPSMQKELGNIRDVTRTP